MDTKNVDGMRFWVVASVETLKCELKRDHCSKMKLQNDITLTFPSFCFVSPLSQFMALGIEQKIHIIGHDVLFVTEICGFGGEQVSTSIFCSNTIILQPFDERLVIIEACVCPLVPQRRQSLIKPWSGAGSQSQAVLTHSDQTCSSRVTGLQMEKGKTLTFTPLKRGVTSDHTTQRTGMVM